MSPLSVQVLSERFLACHTYCDIAASDFAKIQLINRCRMQRTRVEECTNCFVYELSNNFVPKIGSASKKHPLRKNVGTMRVSVYTKRFKK